MNISLNKLPLFHSQNNFLLYENMMIFSRFSSLRFLPFTLYRSILIFSFISKASHPFDWTFICSSCLYIYTLTRWRYTKVKSKEYVVTRSSRKKCKACSQQTDFIFFDCAIETVFVYIHKVRIIFQTNFL
jgi:hypothetical protein